MKIEKEIVLLFSIYNLYLFGVSVEEIAAVHNLRVDCVISLIDYLPVYRKYKEKIKYDRLNITVSPETDELYEALLYIAEVLK